MWACCPSRHCLYSLTPALEWLLKPAQKRVIRGPSPPKEFQAFPFTLFFHSEHKPAAHLNLVPCLHKAPLRAPAGLRGLYHPLPTFCTNVFSILYPPRHPCPSWGAAGIVPGQGLCSEQGAELILHCHAQHRLRAAALQVNFPLAKWWQGKALFLPHRGESSAFTLNTCPKYFHVLKITSEIRGYLTLPNCGVCSTQCITGKYLCD